MSLKSLVDPFVIILLSQCFVIILVWRKKRFINSAIIANGTLVLLLIILSLPISSAILSNTLQASYKSNIEKRPTHLIVLAGGYQPSYEVAQDILILESQKRVMHAIALWKKNRSTILVFSGASLHPNRPNTRQVELMADLALMNGVTESSIVLEPKSINTLQHPIEVLKLPNVDARTHIGIVTSGWHMPRALIEFKRHFDPVTACPVPSNAIELTFRSLIPNPDSLSYMTTMLREAVGIIWYEFIHEYLPL